MNALNAGFAKISKIDPYDHKINLLLYFDKPQIKAMGFEAMKNSLSPLL